MEERFKHPKYFKISKPSSKPAFLFTGSIGFPWNKSSMSKFSTQVIPNAVPRALACRSPSMADPVDPARRKSSEYDIYVIYMYHFADMPHGYASIEIFTYNLV